MLQLNAIHESDRQTGLLAGIDRDISRPWHEPDSLDLYGVLANRQPGVLHRSESDDVAVDSDLGTELIDLENQHAGDGWGGG